MNSSKSILVVDHTGQLDRFVCNVLGQEQWLIENVETRDELDTKVFSAKPSIIIINASLPKLQLADFVQLLRANFSAREQPYLVLTISKEIQKHLRSNLQQLVDEVLIAPFYGIDLVTKVNNASKKSVPATASASLLKSAVNKVKSIKRESAKVTLINRELPAKKPVVPLNELRQSKPPVASSEWFSRKNISTLLVRINNLGPLVNDLEPESAVKKMRDVKKQINDSIANFGGEPTFEFGDIMLFSFDSALALTDHRVSAIQAAFQLQLASLFFIEEHQLGERDVSLTTFLHTAMVTLVGEQGSHKTKSIASPLLPQLMHNLSYCNLAGIYASEEFYQPLNKIICIAEEYSVESTTESTVKFALISALNTSEYTADTLPIFKVS